MAITKSAMSQLRAYINFTQIRFHCSKEKETTFHVRTTLNNKGTEAVRYFSGERDEMPDSCDSFVRMDGDNSRLAQNCATWAYDGKWGHVTNGVGENRLYDHAATSCDILTLNCNQKRYEPTKSVHKLYPNKI